MFQEVVISDLISENTLLSHLPKNSQTVVSVHNQTELQANCVTEYVDQELHYQAPRLLETLLQEVYYFNCMSNHKEKQQKSLWKIWLKYNFHILNRNVLQDQSKAIYHERFLKNHWNTQSAFYKFKIWSHYHTTEVTRKKVFKFKCLSSSGERENKFAEHLKKISFHFDIHCVYCWLSDL